jgi:HK97 gp10 family phage protein
MTAFKITGLDGVLETLKSMPPEIVSKSGGPVKLALKKGAGVIWKQAYANLQTVTSNTDDEGKTYSTGLLMQNLVVTRGKQIFGAKGERYLVRVRRKSYARKGKPVTTQSTGQRLEYGTSKQPAEPWLRPAFESKKQEAIDVTVTDLKDRIDKVANKLLKTNANK